MTTRSRIKEKVRGVFGDSLSPDDAYLSCEYSVCYDALQRCLEETIADCSD